MPLCFMFIYIYVSVQLTGSIHLFILESSAYFSLSLPYTFSFFLFFLYSGCFFSSVSEHGSHETALASQTCFIRAVALSACGSFFSPWMQSRDIVHRISGCLPFSLSFYFALEIPFVHEHTSAQVSPAISCLPLLFVFTFFTLPHILCYADLFVHYFWLCFSLAMSCSPFVSYFDSSLFRIGLALTQAHPLNPLRHRGGTLLRRARPQPHGISAPAAFHYSPFRGHVYFYFIFQCL